MVVCHFHVISLQTVSKPILNQFRFKSKLVFSSSYYVLCSNVMQCLYDDRESSIEEATRLVFRSYLVVLDVLCAS